MATEMLTSLNILSILALWTYPAYLTASYMYNGTNVARESTYRRALIGLPAAGNAIASIIFVVAMIVMMLHMEHSHRVAVIRKAAGHAETLSAKLPTKTVASNMTTVVSKPELRPTKGQSFCS